MRAFKKLLTVTGHMIIGLSFISGFAVGAIFGETVINKFGPPTVITYYLAK